MQDESHYPLSHLGNAEVGMQPTLEGQDILIEHGDFGQHLACLLACGKADIVRRAEATHWRIAHDRRVDDLLVVS